MKHDESVAINRVSLCSLDNSAALAAVKSKEAKIKNAAPKDKFFFVHILFFLLGLMHLIPFTFFLNANAYWMYKFRNITADITDTDARTVLQTHFSSGNNVINCIVSPLSMILSTFYGYKVKARLRVLVVLSILSLSFLAGTAFVKIDTDSWQLLLFLITIMILGVIGGANWAFSAGNMTILSRFPRHYIKAYLLGQGCGPLSSSSLQVISLAIGTSTEVSALIYFISGSGLMILTLTIFYLSKYNELYNYHLSSSEEDTLRDVISLSELKVLAKQIWSPIVTYVIISLPMDPVFSNITALVVSENYGSGSLWTDKYYVPVVSYLFFDITSLLGRMACPKNYRVFGGVSLTVFMLLRMFLYVPLIYFCNAQPRHHIPLLLPHDWQYILILGTFAFSNGYLSNLVYFDVAKLVGPEKVEDAYLIMLSCISLVGLITLPIGWYSVDIL